MPNQYISINSTSSLEKIAESRRMADGSMKMYWIANKYKWTIQWTSLRESSIAAIETIAKLTTSITFIDYDAVSHTVVLLPGCFKKTISADKVSSLARRFFDVELVLDEV
jgi:hypothetical protein